VLTSPLVISGQTLLANLEGANSLAQDRNWGGRIYVPGTGQIVIALQALPGAVQGSVLGRSEIHMAGATLYGENGVANYWW
jgi:hypothetical protein